MPRATLSFTLPEEEAEFRMASGAGALWCAAEEFQNFLRSTRKYRELTSDQATLLEEIHTKYWETIGPEYEKVNQ